MPRMDDYLQALELGKGALKDRDPDQLAALAGVETRKREGGVCLLVPFLKEKVTIGWPDLKCHYADSEREPPIQQQILLLHYLQGAWSSKGAKVKGEWIAFQDLPDGRFYLDSFQRRAKIPLLKAFGSDPEKLIRIAGAAYGAKPIHEGDCSVLVLVLPLVPVALVLWRGDEEFPPEGNILFDRNISALLSAEDVAWLSGMVVYPLAGMAK